MPKICLKHLENHENLNSTLSRGGITTDRVCTSSGKNFK